MLLDVIFWIFCRLGPVNDNFFKPQATSNNNLLCSMWLNSCWCRWILFVQFAVFIRTPFPHLGRTNGHLGKFSPACSSCSGIERFQTSDVARNARNTQKQLRKVARNKLAVKLPLSCLNKLILAVLFAVWPTSPSNRWQGKQLWAKCSGN